MAVDVTSDRKAGLSLQREVTTGGSATTSVFWRAGTAIRNSQVVVGLMSTIPAGGAVALRYHSVSDDAGWRHDYIQNSLAVSPAVFDRQMEFLKRRHTVVGIGKLAELVRTGSRIDRRLAAITFDDGYEDNYRNALPILRKHGLTAAFYVTSGSVDDATILWTVKLRFLIRRCTRDSLELSFMSGRPLDVSSDPAKESAIRLLTGVVKRCPAPEADEIMCELEDASNVAARSIGRRIMMNEGELRAMREAGMTIGSHTVSHYNLPCLDTRDVATEVGDSKAFLEGVLGESVEHLAYPDGRTGRHFDGRVARVVAMAGFRSAVTSVAGPVSPKCSELSIPRLGVTPKHRRMGRLAADIQYARFTRLTDRAFEEVCSMTGMNGSDADDGGGGARPRPVRP